MEHQKTVLGARKTSAFNPEAATFSPTHIAAVSKDKESTGSVIDTPPPTLKYDSPLRPAENMRPVYHGESTISHVPLASEDLPFRDIHLEGLQKMLMDHYIASNRDKTVMSGQHHALTTDTVSCSVTQPPPFRFPPLQPEPSFNTIDVDELSASLGLPSVNKTVAVNGPLERSHESRPSHGNSDPHFGRLIGKALDTPLTADLLAQYLHTAESTSGHDIAGASRKLQESMLGFGTHNDEGKSTKMVRPPPGFHGAASREVEVESPKPIPTSVTELQYVPTGPAHLSRSQRDSPFQAVNHTRHHSRHSSGKRRPRAHTRVKRSDQGPEPSPADIYPDDANWEPSYMPLKGRETLYRRPSFVPQLSPQRELQVGNSISWPTPAEVYTQAAPAGVYTQKPVTPPRSPVINIFENHFPPTPADVAAADEDVLALMNEIPGVSIPTLLRFGTFDMVCDGRALSPGQEDASRYGLKSNGIGLNIPWSCPLMEEGIAFRVRPRNHEGWGGWEWALKRGWGNE